MAGSSRLPSGRELAAGLARAVDGRPGEGGRVVARAHNPYSSTFASELVAYRPAGRPAALRLFIKYGDGPYDPGFGHRGGVAYEARVYREVLSPLGVSVPPYLGTYRGQFPGSPWLVLGCVQGGRRASWMKRPDAIVASARWIGRFHALNAPRLRSPRLGFLRRYDRAYYGGWVERARRLLRPIEPSEPWLARALDGAEAAMHRLDRSPRTVIHGEYFGSNILCRRGTVHPVDWQSAAVAPGEIDLAMLTHSWPPGVRSACLREYARARWPDGAPERWGDRFRDARLYADLRWLGDPAWLPSSRPFDGPSGAARHRRYFLEDLRALSSRPSGGSDPPRAARG